MYVPTMLVKEQGEKDGSGQFAAHRWVVIPIVGGFGRSEISQVYSNVPVHLSRDMLSVIASELTNKSQG
jgi:hypothetical protein